MLDRPTGAELLAEARRTLLETLLPLLPSDRRYDALMVANAMAIAARELTDGVGALQTAVGALASLGTRADGADAALAEQLERLERQLARDIRTGAYDAPGSRRDAASRYLREVTTARLRLSNPKALGNG
jgi:glutathione S-transferase